MLELGALETLGVIEDDFADLERPFLRDGEEARGEDVHARPEEEELRRLLDGVARRVERRAHEAGEVVETAGARSREPRARDRTSWRAGLM